MSPEYNALAALAMMIGEAILDLPVAEVVEDIPEIGPNFEYVTQKQHEQMCTELFQKQGITM